MIIPTKGEVKSRQYIEPFLNFLREREVLESHSFTKFPEGCAISCLPIWAYRSGQVPLLSTEAVRSPQKLDHPPGLLIE